MNPVAASDVVYAANALLEMSFNNPNEMKTPLRNENSLKVSEVNQINSTF